jgi:formamidopyrimidine-DNA glycosylase
MPELPDVELFKRRVDEHVLHQTIREVVVGDARVLGDLPPETLAEHLEGAHFEASRRHGKHLLVRLDRGGWLTLHFGMTGSLEVFERIADDPPYDRVRFDFAGGRHLAYVSLRLLGRIGLADDAETFIRGEELGPDALDPAFDQAAFTAALAGSRRKVKAALMDQAVMAGIGNIYSDEILFQANIHPATRLDALDGDRLARLFDTLKRVLQTAMAQGAGSERFLDRLPAGFLLPQRRKDGRCPRCGAGIRTLKASGRSAYYCARCQNGGPGDNAPASLKRAPNHG